MSTFQAGPKELWFLPLGGSGEFGINLNLYAHAGSWIMLDCGMMLAQRRYGNAVVLPDSRFIEARRGQLLGIVATHAHQDHIGAIPYLWRRLRCPIYATPFTARLIYDGLARVGLQDRVYIHVIDPGQRFQLGPFGIEYVQLTHSIPEPMGVIIDTSLGKVFHSGDFKLDPTPVCGPSYNQSRLLQLARDPVLCMVTDSTNADVPGHTASEQSLQQPLRQIVDTQAGRVIVTCFSSNIARLMTLAEIAASTGRCLSLLGRSLRSTVAAARMLGHFSIQADTVEERHAGLVPRRNLLAVVTGSQGELGSVMYRLANDTHPSLNLEQGDAVVFSARNIPGNEAQIATVTQALARRGIKVIDPRMAHTHVSGHPAQQELQRIYGWVKPLSVLAVHGTPDKLRANVRIAAACHIPVQRAARNGDLVRLESAALESVAQVATGRVMVDGHSLRRMHAPPQSTDP